MNEYSDQDRLGSCGVLVALLSQWLHLALYLFVVKLFTFFYKAYSFAEYRLNFRNTPFTNSSNLFARQRRRRLRVGVRPGKPRIGTCRLQPLCAGTCFTCHHRRWRRSACGTCVAWVSRIGFFSSYDYDDNPSGLKLCCQVDAESRCCRELFGEDESLTYEELGRFAAVRRSTDWKFAA